MIIPDIREQSAGSENSICLLNIIDRVYVYK